MDKHIKDEFSRNFATIVSFEVPLASYTSFKIGGPAECLAAPSGIDELRRLIVFCTSHAVPFRILGKGSNVLVADSGLAGVVIRLAENFAAMEVRGKRIYAQAGAANSDIAALACSAGLCGYEFACGIPGTIGGAAFMNAGAYEGSFSDLSPQMSICDNHGEISHVSFDSGQWAYRQSPLQQSAGVLCEVVISLKTGDPKKIQTRMDELNSKRKDKQPLDLPSAGSTFRRPPGYYCGALIDAAGLRGLTIGGAQVSTKHAGFIVNRGEATATDVYLLVKEIQMRVYENSGVELQPELRMWGFENDVMVRNA